MDADEAFFQSAMDCNNAILNALDRLEQLKTEKAQRTRPGGRIELDSLPDDEALSAFR